jgi:hypothetical protein
MNDEERAFSQLKTTRLPSATIVDVRYDTPTPQIALRVAGRLLLCGDWGIDLSIDGKPVPAAGTWECLCFNSDKDGDYLELQLMAREDVRVERFIYLPRVPGPLVLADAVYAIGAGQVDCTMRLPLVEGQVMEPDRPTRELRVRRGGRTEMRVFPLLSEQDRILHDPRTVAPVDGTGIQHKGLGRGGFFPVIIDFDASRRTLRAVWRRATVSEHLTVLPSDRAAGYRWKCGDVHWVVYRTLTPGKEGRAVLGLHTRNETVVAKMDSTGRVLPLVAIE